MEVKSDILFSPQVPVSVMSMAPTKGRVIQPPASAPVSQVSGDRSATAASRASGTSVASSRRTWAAARVRNHFFASALIEQVNLPYRYTVTVAAVVCMHAAFGSLPLITYGIFTPSRVSALKLQIYFHTSSHAESIWFWDIHLWDSCCDLDSQVNYIHRAQ